MGKYKTTKMTDGEFYAYRDRVQKQCPRKHRIFCDGEPNPIPQGEHVNYGVCEHFKNGKCVFFDKKKQEK